MPTVRITAEEEARLIAQGAVVKHCNHAALNGALLDLSPPADGCDEKAFQARVVKVAPAFGWERTFHVFDSRRSAPGFPDLWLGRTWGKTRLVVFELKVYPNKPTADQSWWLKVLDSVGIPAFVFYPDQWAEIVAVLKRA